MKGLRVAILITAALGLAAPLLAGLTLVLIAPVLGPSCSDVCDVYWFFLGLVIAFIGAAATFASMILVGIDAGRRGDWWSVGLVTLQLVVSIGAVVYLIAATAATNGPGGPTTGAPASSLAVAIGAFCLLAAPLSTLLYGVFRDGIAVHRVSLATLAVLVVLAPVVAAPPWVAFNTANGAPVLSVNATGGNGVTMGAPNVTVDCSTGPFLPIAVTNTGGGTLQWTAATVDKSNIAPVTISPSSGTLAPGMTEIVTLGAPSAAVGGPYQYVSVLFHSNGGEGDVTYTCK